MEDNRKSRPMAPLIGALVKPTHSSSDHYWGSALGSVEHSASARSQYSSTFPSGRLLFPREDRRVRRQGKMKGTAHEVFDRCRKRDSAEAPPRVDTASAWRSLSFARRELVACCSWAAVDEITSWKQDQEQDQNDCGQKASEDIPEPGRRKLLHEIRPTSYHFDLAHVTCHGPAPDTKDLDPLVLGKFLAERCPGKVGLSAHRAHRRRGHLLGQLHDLHGIVAVAIPQIVGGDGHRADENQHREHDRHSCDSPRYGLRAPFAFKGTPRLVSSDGRLHPTEVDLNVVSVCEPYTLVYQCIRGSPDKFCGSRGSHPSEATEVAGGSASINGEFRALDETRAICREEDNGFAKSKPPSPTVNTTSPRAARLGVAPFDNRRFVHSAAHWRGRSDCEFRHC